MPNLRQLYLVIFILFAITACDDSAHYKKIHGYIDHLKKTMVTAKKKEVMPELVFPTPATFKGDTMRPPFNSSDIYSNNKNMSINPLAAYPVSMLKFTGTLINNSDIYAYIMAPDNKLYQAKVGDIIGIHYGKIVNIYPDRVEVVEPVVVPGKPTTQSTITLQLKEER